MLSISVSQAQKQFTSLLGNITTIVDKKSNVKKAVLMPYDMYESLISKINNDKKVDLTEFTGMLNKDFKTNDSRYEEIIK